MWVVCDQSSVPLLVKHYLIHKMTIYEFMHTCSVRISENLLWAWINILHLLPAEYSVLVESSIRNKVFCEFSNVSRLGSDKAIYPTSKRFLKCQLTEQVEIKNCLWSLVREIIFILLVLRLLGFRISKEVWSQYCTVLSLTSISCLTRRHHLEAVCKISPRLGQSFA